jgi:Haem-NO-binding
MVHCNDTNDDDDNDDDSGRAAMKGMIFTEFLELVERTHSAELAETLLANADLPSGGIYTAVGNYDHREMVTLVVALSRQTRQPVDEVLHWFGENLFVTLSTGYPGFFADKDNAFSVLVGIESVIHTEVRKLYPDAELPSFDVIQHGRDELVLDYRSPRCMDDLAHGMIDACIAHFDEPVTLARRPLGQTQADGTRFTLTRA